jgi:hypothetical protein
MYEKNNISDWIVEILSPASEKIFMGEKPHSLNETAPCPNVTGKQICCFNIEVSIFVIFCVTENGGKIICFMNLF